MFVNTNKSSSSSTVFTPIRGFYTVLGIIFLFFSHLVYSRVSSPSNLPHQVNESVVSAATTKTTTTPTKKQQEHLFHHVLAYGDSLTAGVCSRTKSEYTPYAPYLEKSLNDMAISDGWKDGSQVEVHHLGLPGWTTAQMLQNQSSDGVGLIPFIDVYHEPSPSLVILMAGTNDLGKHSESEIIDHLHKIHQLCYDHGVPRTLAIGIPPSGYQASWDAMAEKAKRINDAIQEFTEGEDRATYVEFPFPYEKDGEYWCHDTLHFSTKGYEKLGTSLAPYVQEILTKLDDSHATGEGSE